ncbi:hypothetical protein HELRODRAFT_172649 [Helobdella robusta]|uniref:Uncharacterized protein n=1 Tax=Helobdella robusta TaxID=6412 RepID=T1F5Q2_HELRO|nr:hypothetical protein HELRODRAFT_172649 [Helobdella robusta]ESO04292.1 hypothetical protein HELRODRAFT_172649 [Helobdella robusta]
MGTKKKPKDTSLEMRTTESNFCLKLCEDCLSCNKERLTQILKKNLLCESSVPVVEVLSAEIKTSTQSMISRMNFLEEAVKAQSEEWKLGGVNLLSFDVKMMKESIQATSTKMDVINKREKRKNNIILYNMSEKENIKESVNKLLKEISGRDLGTEVVEISRLGRKKDRISNRKIFEEKKKEIGEKDDVSKWSFRLKGVPGDFYVIAFKKQNLLK